MVKEYRYSWIRRLGNAVLGPALKLGIGPARSRLLSVKGRRSGKTYTTPVNLVLREGQRYLVSPYGERAWVKNARAAGEVSLRRGGKTERLAIEELGPADAAPVLRDYWQQNFVTRPFFAVRPDAGDDAFVREAAHHPVFRLR